MQNLSDLNSQTAYLRWRDRKLAHAITNTNELIVEINNPHALTAAEHAKLFAHCRSSDMAIYATVIWSADENMLRQLGQLFGLNRLDANWLASVQSVTRITVCVDDRPNGRFAAWYCCVQDAEQGGGNCLLDHEIVYLMLRDANTDFIRALSAPDSMAIPECPPNKVWLAPRRLARCFDGPGKRYAAHAPYRAHPQHRRKQDGGHTACCCDTVRTASSGFATYSQSAAKTAWGCCATTYCMIEQLSAMTQTNRVCSIALAITN